MTRLNQSQMLVGIQPAYGVSHFDRGNGTTVDGGNGGNSLGFIPGLGGYFVYSATPDLKFGISLGSNFGLSAEYESTWAGRFYGTKSELITLGAFPDDDRPRSSLATALHKGALRSRLAPPSYTTTRDVTSPG